MESYTYMSKEAVEAICDANDRQVDEAVRRGEDPQYMIGLNDSEFRNLIAVLAWFYENGPENLNPLEQAADDLPEWAGDFVSSIGETLGVEMI